MLRRYPAVFLLPFIVLGIVLADLIRPESEWLFVACLLTGLTGLLIWKNRSQSAVIAFGLSLAGFAAFQYAVNTYDRGPGDLGDRLEPGRRYTVYARVSDWPAVKPNRTEILLEVDSIGRSDKVFLCHGGLLLKVTERTTALQRGDAVLFSARLYPPRGGPSLTGFDYGLLLKRRGVVAVAYMDNLLSMKVNRRPRSDIFWAVHVVRQAILQTFRQHLSPASAALASGFLIGETRDVPVDIYNMFRDSGTLHLLAVSGSNVALIVLFMIVVLRPLHPPRRLRAVVLWLAILFFCWLSYVEPSVVRASVMASLIILAQVLERRYDPNNIIAVTALLILLVAPAQLYSVGFQLSFVTAWGLILVFSGPKSGDKSLVRSRVLRWLLLLLAATVTAQFFSAPLSAYYFERIPLASPLANLLIVPAVSLAVLGSMILLLLELLLPVIAGWFGQALDLLLKTVIAMLQWFGGEHSLVWKMSRPSWLTVSGCYVVLVMAALSLRRPSLRRNSVIVALLITNFWLASQLVGSLGARVGEEAYVLTVPGGTATVVRRTGSTVGDMYITTAESRGYSLAETIIAPQLQAIDLTHLRHLVLLDADYGALADILRLAEQLGTDSVFLPCHLRASAIDAGRRANHPPGKRPWRFFRPSGDVAGDVEIIDGMIRMSTGQAELWLATETGANAVGASGEWSGVVTGRLTCEKLAGLKASFDLVICANLEQGKKPGPSPPGTVDLSRSGSVRIDLQGDFHQPGPTVRSGAVSH